MSASQLEAELARMRPIGEEMTGLSSRWNGTVTITTTAELLMTKGRTAYAEKQWSCGITVNVSIETKPIRWRSLLHELIHSVSVGTNAADCKLFLGWEEGVVEQVQRLIRPEVLARIGEQIDQDVFHPAEEEWGYNRFIIALEELRTYLDCEPLPFDLGLLRTPLAERMGTMMAMSEDSAFRRLFALDAGKLRR